MLWFPTLSEPMNSFHSIIADTDEASSGEWLVAIPVPDTQRLWEELEDAAVEGRLPAVKKARDHSLACVYCRGSSDGTAYQVS